MVTGASGWIGSSVVLECLAQGIETIGVSRSIPREPQVAARTFQVSDYGDLPCPDGARLVHCAEERHIDRIKDPYAAPKLLRRLMDKPFTRITYLSSAVVYGDKIESPRAETEPTVASTPYSVGKCFSEEIVKEGDGTVLRLANVYGSSEMAEYTVIGDILAQLGMTGAVMLRDVSSVRDFVHLSDVARVIVKFVRSGLSGIYNVGTGRATSIAELAKTMLVLAGESDREVVASEPKKISHIVLNVEKVARVAGWRAAVPLEEGLRQLIGERVA